MTSISILVDPTPSAQSKLKMKGHANKDHTPNVKPKNNSKKGIKSAGARSLYLAGTNYGMNFNITSIVSELVLFVGKW